MAASASPSKPAEDIQDFRSLTPEEVKSHRTNGRREVTAYCNRIVGMVNEPGSSRTVIKSFFSRAQRAYELSWHANTVLLESCGEDAATAEMEKQVHYLQKVEEVEEIVQQYLESRADDAPSVTSRSSGNTVLSQPPLTQQPKSEETRDAVQTSQQQSTESQLRPEQHNDFSAQVQPSALDHQQLAPVQRNPLRQVGVPREPAALQPFSPQQPFTIREPPLRLVDQPIPHNSSRLHQTQRDPFMNRFLQDAAARPSRSAEIHDPGEAPDAWIEEYVSGREPADAWSQAAGYRSSVSAELEAYDGSPLAWFAWIDLFKSLVHDTSKPPGEKLAILKRYLHGHCRDVVYGLGGGEIAYKEALYRLKETCGRRDVLRVSHIQALEKLNPGSQPNQFQRYAEKVRTHLFDLTRLGELYNLDLVERVLSNLKLADRLAYNEAKAAGRIQQTLLGFGRWLCSRAAAYTNAFDIAAEFLHRQPEQTTKANRVADRPPKRTMTTQTASPKNRPCSHCDGQHQLAECGGLQGLSVGQRLQHCSEHKLCFACLKGNHRARNCSSSKECRIDGCKRRHHQLLHESPAAATSSSVHAVSTSPLKVAIGILKVAVISASDNRVHATAFVDEGSDCSLIREDFLKKIGLQGTPHPLRLHGVTGAWRELESQRVTVELEELNGGNRFRLTANSVPKICNPVAFIPWPKLKSKWSHLKDLHLSSVGGKVDLLLGLDNAELLVAEEVRTGSPREPIAIRTSLGWVPRGVIGDNPLTPKNARVNLLCRNAEDDLTIQFRRFCDLEAYGTEAICKPRYAPEDERAVRILEEGAKFLDPGYEVPIPWKEGEPSLPNNRTLAEFRLKGLLRRFNGNPSFAVDYARAMKKYVEEGYTHEVQQPDLDSGPQYFLPHHGVYKKSSSERKIRIVFDAAAKFQGKCLNDAQHSGPALQNDLPAVLLRFREGAFAVVADVNAMFSRIRLRPEDARFHRYLWIDEKTEKVKVFQMDRVSFGDRSSPFMAIYTTRRVARDFGSCSPEAISAIETNLYMDDYLDSSRTESEAISKSTAVKNILAKGDFHLAKWQSNSPAIVHTLSEEHVPSVSEDVRQLGSDEYSTKILGICWKPTRDVLCFVPDKAAEPVFSRMGLLSKVARIFDPLGFLAPPTVRLKSC